jgi:hypothetical protein
MTDWIEDLRKVDELTQWWDHLSDVERRKIAAMVADSRNTEEALRFIKFIKHISKSKWAGFPEEQKQEIAAKFPRLADDVEWIEAAARTYVESTAAESDWRAKDRIVGLCLKLSDELEAHDHLAFGPYETLREALNQIKTSSGKHRRQPKDNARQDARNVFMKELLDTWLVTGGELGGARSSLVAFIKAAWPEQLIRNRPTPAAIVQWVHKNEREPQRVMLELVRRILATKSGTQEERELAFKRLQRFETGHPEAVAELRNGLSRYLSDISR